MTNKQVKDLIARVLTDRGVNFSAIKSKTVSFSDLARSEGRFFSVQGLVSWDDNKRAAFADLKNSLPPGIIVGGFVGVGHY